MPLVDATSTSGGTPPAATLFSAEPGDRLLVVTGHRSDGETVTVSPDIGGGTWTQRRLLVTNVLDSGSRRGVALFDLEVSETVGSQALTADWRNVLGQQVSGYIIVARFTEGAGYTFVDAAAADSGASNVAQQGTGTTGVSSAGDVLVVAGEVHRGAAAPTWDVTDETADPDLVVQSGSGNNALVGSMGVLAALAQPSQTWSDTVTLSTARMTSALLAVWDTVAGGPGEITGTGELTAPAARVSGAGTVAATGSGELNAPAALVDGTAAAVIAGAGETTAPAATVGGAGTVTTTGTGELTAPAATVSGAGNIGEAGAVNGTGQLTAPAAAAAGAGAVTATGSGVIVAAGVIIDGTGATIVTGAGELVAPAAAVSGAEKPPSPLPAVPILTAAQDRKLLTAAVNRPALAAVAEQRALTDAADHAALTATASRQTLQAVET